MSTSAPPPEAPAFGAIPPWTLSGVLPPYLGDPTTSLNMAPYPTTIEQVIIRFASTPKRKEIFQGLIDYRQSLADIGIIDGFQWLNGSILENIETLESRDPKDIDIVTFFRRPIGAKDPITWSHFFAANQNTFSPLRNKTLFKCDTQYVELDSSAEDVVNLTRFWFGLFSHRRDNLWKGMLIIPLLVGNEDEKAKSILNPSLAALSTPTPSSAP